MIKINLKIGGSDSY